MKRPTVKCLEDKALQIRNLVLDTFDAGHAGHISSSFSCTDIMTALFYGNILRYDVSNPKWDGRDRFLLSKGHAGILYYSILADLGYFDKAELSHFAQKGGLLGVHVDQRVPGVEANSGSLGCGLGIASGMALAAKLDMKNHLVFVIIGDGECYEGSVWESAMHAAGFGLNNLVVIVDHNHMCCTGFIEDKINIEPLDKKWESFGYEVRTINGHNFDEILTALDGVRCRKFNKPLCIIADTVKAKGLPSVENTPLCHGYAPTKPGELEKAKAELNGGKL